MENDYETCLKKKEDSEDIIVVYPEGNIRVFEYTDTGVSSLRREYMTLF